MRFILAAVAMLVTATLAPSSVFAASHQPPATCTVNPNPAAAGSTYTVSATGLLDKHGNVATNVELWLMDPPGTNQYLDIQGPVIVNPDGTASVDTTLPVPGNVNPIPGPATYTFHGVVSGQYAFLATCTVQIT